MAARKTKLVPYRAYVKGKRAVPGIQIRHEVGCPAYLPENAKRACLCTRTSSRATTRSAETHTATRPVR
jgi:hypothetical protein